MHCHAEDTRRSGVTRSSSKAKALRILRETKLKNVAPERKYLVIRLVHYRRGH
jgi:hypothetical protein